MITKRPIDVAIIGGGCAGITAAFESVSPLGTVPGVGAGKKTVNIYLCRNYQTMPL